MPDYDNMKISTSRLRRCLSLRTCRDPAYRTGTPALARPHRRRHWSWRPSRIFLMGALTPFRSFLHPPVASAQTRLSMTQTRAFIVCLSALRSLSPRWFLVESPLLSLTDATRAARRFACAISPLHSAPPVVPRRLKSLLPLLGPNAMLPFVRRLFPSNPPAAPCLLSCPPAYLSRQLQSSQQSLSPLRTIRSFAASSPAVLTASSPVGAAASSSPQRTGPTGLSGAPHRKLTAMPAHQASYSSIQPRSSPIQISAPTILTLPPTPGTITVAAC